MTLIRLIFKKLDLQLSGEKLAKLKNILAIRKEELKEKLGTEKFNEINEEVARIEKTVDTGENLLEKIVIL